MNVLFLSGYNSHRGALESFDYNQSYLKSLLKSSNWNIFEKRVEDEESIRDAYDKISGPLLVIYTGHGNAGPSSHPWICPINKEFDLLKIHRNDTTSYIMDCCNVDEKESPLARNTENHGEPTYSTQCLDPAQKYIICMRRQVCGYAVDLGTYLNLAMCGIMYNFTCANIHIFCKLLNTLCNVTYKRKNLISNRRIHYVITLNRYNPGRTEEGPFLNQLTKVKLPSVTYAPPPQDSVPQGPGRSLVQHLGAPGAGSDPEEDELDQVAEESFDVFASMVVDRSAPLPMEEALEASEKIGV